MASSAMTCGDSSVCSPQITTTSSASAMQPRTRSAHAPPHPLGPRLVHLAALGAARDGEGRGLSRLLHEAILEIAVVLVVEAHEDADVGHGESFAVGRESARRGRARAGSGPGRG